MISILFILSHSISSKLNNPIHYCYFSQFTDREFGTWRVARGVQVPRGRYQVIWPLFSDCASLGSETSCQGKGEADQDAKEQPVTWSERSQWPKLLAYGQTSWNVKSSVGDRIPVELFQILKDDPVKMLHSICQQIWKTQQCPQDWKSFHSSPKERQCQRMFKLPHNCAHFTC